MGEVAEVMAFQQIAFAYGNQSQGDTQQRLVSLQNDDIPDAENRGEGKRVDEEADEEQIV